jgi:hypothetical protein
MGNHDRTTALAEALAANDVHPSLAKGEHLEGHRLDRYLLIEKNIAYDEPPHYVTTHATPEAAGAYHWGQEYYADWEIAAVLDLDTGDRYEVEQRYIATKLVATGGG